jgi:hypothetical protein
MALESNEGKSGMGRSLPNLTHETKVWSTCNIYPEHISTWQKVFIHVKCILKIFFYSTRVSFSRGYDGLVSKRPCPLRVIKGLTYV